LFSRQARTLNNITAAVAVVEAWAVEAWAVVAAVQALAVVRVVAAVAGVLARRWLSRGPSGPSNFGNGGSARQFSRTNQGPQGRTVYNQERGNRNLYNRYEGENRNRFENREGNRFGNREGNRFNGRNPDHRGVVSGNFFEHGRHFGFRRFFNGEWVFLTDWDSCTAWAWVNVAPGAWAWRPVDVCIG
jgi:hypothetical protein